MQRQRALFPVSYELSDYNYGERSSGETHGVVLTKPHVVDLILNLANYTNDKPLCQFRLLEPSCGEGAFLLPAIDRLLSQFEKAGGELHDLDHCISAFDIDHSHVKLTKERIVSLLASRGHPAPKCRELAEEWVTQGDFLLADFEQKFDAIVGNPPYIRIEQISPRLQVEYRERFATLFDRADLYVAFIEKSLQHLDANGILSFICADRWTLNRYGAPLRKIISSQFSVRQYIDLHRASPFETEVIAYPSIFAIGRKDAGPVDVFHITDASPEECASVSLIASGTVEGNGNVSYSRHEKWFDGDSPWTISNPEQMSFLKALEERFALIEADGLTKVSIGIATGNDKIYIVDRSADIEASRLVPLVMRGDLNEGRVRKSDRFVINTFDDSGRVIDLAMYPKLAAYFESAEEIVKRRHVAKKNPKAWFRTIDKLHASLTQQPKLLIPDIAGSNEVTFEPGHYYPHHNLYYLTSDRWDLEVLGGILSSKIALFFIWSYAVKMRGGYLRFQAQYLRRIRVPDPTSISIELSNGIRDAFRDRNFGLLDELAKEVYGVNAVPDFSFVDTRK